MLVFPARQQAPRSRGLPMTPVFLFDATALAKSGRDTQMRRQRLRGISMGHKLSGSTSQVSDVGDCARGQRALQTAISFGSSFGRKAQQHLPAFACNAMKRVYHSALLPLTYDSDAAYAGAKLPPAVLRHRVNGTPNAEHFLAEGRRAFEAVSEGFALAGF
jgi:hypothetical protein